MKSKENDPLLDAVGTATVVTETPGERKEVEYLQIDQAMAKVTPAHDDLTAVVVIRTKGQSSLVEWQDEAGSHRSWMPARSIRYRDDLPYVKEPAQGIAYGVDFAEAIRGKVSPKEIHTALNKAGVWTWEDVLAQPATVVAVVTDATGVANHLLATAREEANNG